MNVRPAPTASGTLERRPLVHLFVYVLERGLSGSLELSPVGAPTCAVVFAGGQPTKYGVVDGEGSDAAKPLVERLEELFALPPQTAFAYFDAFDALPAKSPTRASALRVIWRGLLRAPPLDHVKAAITKIGTGRIRLTQAIETAVGESLGEDAARVLARLQGGARSLAGLGEGVPQATLELLVYALMITKRVEIVGAQAMGPRTVSRSIPVPPPAPPKSTSRTTLTPPPPNVTPQTPQVAPPPDSSPVIPPPPPAPSSENLIPEAPPSSGSVGEATPVARVRLKKPASTGPVVAEETAVSHKDPRVSANFDPGAVDAALKTRREDILARSRKIDDEDYFQMLGVARDATQAEVQAAFISLAKTWHPDRLPPPLADMREACSKVFARMSEAQATLVDAEKRGRYMRLLTEGGATPKDQDEIAGVLEAATAFQKAEIFLRRNSNAEAEALVRRAVELDPKQADYQALLAWIEAIKPENQAPDATRQRIAMLARAIDANPKCERAFFYRAMLYKRLKDEKEALSDFRSAAMLNPRNVDAQREVRLYEMRSGAKKPAAKEKEEAPQEKGLFGRFFKK